MQRAQKLTERRRGEVSIDGAQIGGGDGCGARLIVLCRPVFLRWEEDAWKVSQKPGPVRHGADGGPHQAGVGAQFEQSGVCFSWLPGRNRQQRQVPLHQLESAAGGKNAQRVSARRRGPVHDIPRCRSAHLFH